MRDHGTRRPAGADDHPKVPSRIQGLDAVLILDSSVFGKTLFAMKSPARGFLIVDTDGGKL